MTEDLVRERRRGLSLDPTETYLNAGSYSPVALEVQAEQEAWRRRLASSPMRTLLDEMPAGLQRAREALANYLDGPVSRLLLVANVTYAINLAARAVRLEPGDRILMTEEEYGALRFCWEEVARQHGCAIDVVSWSRPVTSGDEIVEAVKRGMTARTKVLFFSHVTSPTGFVLPAEELCALARARGIVSVVDGAHAAGMLPISLRQIDADYYGGNCHKWMMSPMGSGFLAVGERARDTLIPLVVSWGNQFLPDASDAESGWGGSRWQVLLEFHGTVDRTASLVLPSAIAYRQRGPEDAYRARARELFLYAREAIEGVGLRAVTPREEMLSGSMLAFALPRVDAVKARTWLAREHRMWLAFTQVGEESFLRVSTAWFTLKEEIDRFARLLPTVPWERLA